MKILLTFYVLFFSSSVFAEDISDLQIEGMSIGDSLLDYFNEEEIKNNVVNYYNYLDDSFTESRFNNAESFNNYDSLAIAYKTYDDNYVIYAITGVIFFDNNIDGCYKKRDEISNEFSKLLKDLPKEGPDFIQHPADQSGNSTASGISFFFRNNDLVFADCIDWSEGMKAYTDNLSVGVRKEEYNLWLK